MTNIKENNILNGTYRKNHKGFGFVKVEGQEEDIYISSENSKDALNGDMVEIIIDKKDTGKRLEGRIIKILRHETNKVVGTFQNNKNFGFVVPDDKNFGTDIYIPKKFFGKARNNHKVVVKITKYPKKGKNAEGKIIEVIGGINQAGVDMMSLIKQYELPSRFPKPVVEEAKICGDKIDSNDIKNRIDMRDKEIFTIDGEDAKDLDDAVRVEKLENGNFRLDVHIADVSHYVKEDSLLDKEALLRGTSIYMMDRVIPMLPRELSNGICSLNENVDRYTLSCSMEINDKGEVVSSQIYKGVIKVTKRMSYNGVQAALDFIKRNEVGSEIEGKKDDNNYVEEYKPYFEHIKRMAELATILRNRRMEKGYLNLDIPESKITLDPITGKTLDVKKYEQKFANEIIEQFMLTANETVAEKFYWLEAPFIYRVHEEPDMDKVRELNKFLFNFGLKIKFSEEVYPKEFAKILEEIKGREEEKVISNLVLRTLKVARYEAENKGHFGIASKYYCHFTSPIRRYPDLFIHRVISKYLEDNYVVSENTLVKYSFQAEVRAEQSSEREKIASKVEREAQDIKMAEYMEGRIGEQYEGIISSVTNFGIFVELENTIEGLIRFDKLGDEYFIYDEERKRLIGERTNKVYKIGDKVKIEVISASKELREIDFALV